MPIYKGNANVFSKGIELLKEQSNFSDGIYINDEYILSHAQSLIDGDDSDILVEMVDDEIIGMMGIVCFNNPLNGELIANEHFWFVNPGHRGMASFGLVRQARTWAKERKCKHLILCANTMISDMSEKVCLFYERIGMKKFEVSYIERV